MSTTTVLPPAAALPPETITHIPYHPSTGAVRELNAVLDVLDQREMLEPALLLGAGYLALSFVVKQVLLLLAPIAVLLGFGLPEQGESHDRST
ncbi:MAG: hypothetical protein R3E79_19110 [Caldilineaceae bacterium]